MTDGDRWTGLGPGERPYRGTAWYYAEYRDRPTPAFAEKLCRLVGWTRRDRVLDLGAGPAQVSLQLAPFVREVVAVDPEPDMLDEGRRRSEAAGARNVSFVLAGSDDLVRIAPTLGPLAGAAISHAFHWMADQDSVLGALDNLLDEERGAVAIVGYLNDPDPNRVWLDTRPWNVVEELKKQYLADVQPGPHPHGRHDPFPDILARSAFSQVELVTHEYEATIHPSADAAIGFHYTLSNVLAQLGDRRSEFEAEARAALACADTSPLRVKLVDSALVGRRPR